MPFFCENGQNWVILAYFRGSIFFFSLKVFKNYSVRFMGIYFSTGCEVAKGEKLELSKSMLIWVLIYPNGQNIKGF